MSDNWVIRQEVNLQYGPPTPQIWANALLMCGDNKAHTWNVVIRDGQDAASISGSVMGYFCRPDGNTVAIPGTLVQNTASVTLSQDCYAVQGDLWAVMRLATDTGLITLAAITLPVRKVVTDSIIDPGNIIPSLDDLLAQIDAMEELSNDLESAETARANAETARASAESSRVSAEAQRAKAETERLSSETERTSAESERATAEAGRASAESARATAEQARTSAESARVSAEAERASAESARASAESSRVSNEAIRQEALTAAINSASASQTAAESSAKSATNSAALAADAAESVGAMVDVIAKEPTAQQILAIMQQELALLTQIVEEGIAGGGNLNGFSFALGDNGELVISYVNPDDETDTATATFATKAQAQEIAQTLYSTNALLRSMAGVEATEETEV